MNFPETVRYSADHEWVRVEGDIAIVGITDFAQSELGEIVFVDVDTEGESLEAGAAFGNIEAVKVVSELKLPVSGEVIEINGALEDDPVLVNKDPYGEGWIIRVKMSNPSDMDALMDASSYENFIKK